VLGAGFKPVGELHSQPFDSAFVAVRRGWRVVAGGGWLVAPALPS